MEKANHFLESNIYSRRPLTEQNDDVETVEDMVNVNLQLMMDVLSVDRIVGLRWRERPVEPRPK